jgi:dephospho-CoA kinase
MQPVVIAFSGRIASGKSTISSAVAESLHLPYVSFGNYVRFVARCRRLTESREVLQEIGANLVEKDIEGFTRAVLAQADWQPGQSIVVDGIRHMMVLDCLRQIVAPTQLYLIFVAVDEATRSTRLLDREGIGLENYLHLDRDSTEQQVKSHLAEISDLVVDGTHPLEAIVDLIIPGVEDKFCDSE